MAYTFDDMTFLTPGQKGAAQQLSAFSAELVHHKVPEGSIPPLTWSQNKRSLELLGDLDALWGPVRAATQASIRYYEEQEVKDGNAANP